MQHNTDATLCTDSTIKRGNKYCNNICVCVCLSVQKRNFTDAAAVAASATAVADAAAAPTSCLSVGCPHSLALTHTHANAPKVQLRAQLVRSRAVAALSMLMPMPASQHTHTHTLALRSLSKSKFQVRLLQFIREFCCVLHSFLSWLITALQNNSMPYRAIPYLSSLPLSLSLWPPAHQSVNFCFYVSCGPFNCANCATQPSQILVENETGFLFACFFHFYFASLRRLFCFFFFRSLSCAWAEAFCFLLCTFDWVFGMQFYCSRSISPYFGLFLLFYLISFFSNLLLIFLCSPPIHSFRVVFSILS